MTVAFIILMFCVVLVLLVVLGYAIFELARARSDTQSLMLQVSADHRAERGALVNAVIAKHAQDAAVMTRAEGLPDLVRAQADAMSFQQGHTVEHFEDYIDPETHERMSPVGLGG